MDRIICDIYRKDAPTLWGDDPNTPLNQKIIAVNNMFGWLYDTGLLRQVSFEFRETPDAVCFAFDAKDLQPHRREMEVSGIDGAAVAVHNIFDEAYSPCTYSGCIQVSWPMSTYRDVDGCVGRSWECTLIQGLNTEAIYAVNDIREGEGVKAAVTSLFSYYIWPEPEVDRSVVNKGSSTLVTDEQIASAKQCLIDNGIEADEAETVLQALGYILLDCELFPEDRKSFESATFVSVWDGGTCVETSCKVNRATGEVFDIEMSEGAADFVNTLEKEYIRFADGSECIVERGRVDSGFWYDNGPIEFATDHNDAKPSLSDQIKSASTRVSASGVVQDVPAKEPDR